MSAEIHALHDNSTWTLEPLPPGFYRSQADNSLFTRVTHTSITLILAYVDDILVTENDISQVKVFKRILFTHFKTKDLGSLKCFLGLKVAHSHKGIFLNQPKYAIDIFSDSDQLGARTASFLVKQHLKLNNQYGILLPNPCLYRRLIYLTITQPNIVYVVSILN
ncbi:uncharacterized mitochondrial protein AtMg00810-like [Juglans regia]|uniref:Uncharacterized mitochondrial protein AtMg00810-like n=1 Tax=Juglans regia TaxID=51240 RepID=A0A6P9E8I8_JUGRE|nr:uncharacterized mitochondrial protein AtMg00810-like [Juglans regia]